MEHHGAALFPLHVDSTTGEITESTSSLNQATPAAAQQPFSTPSYSAALPVARLVIAAGGEYARITRPRFGPPETREWRRSTISTFSPRSRSRMLQALAKTDRRAVSEDGLFVTLTYPYDWPPSTEACKGHLEALRKRIERQWPSAWFFWKLEYQQRGAEHFHLLVFNLPIYDEKWFQTAWHEIVKLGNHWHKEYGAKVDRLHSWKEAGAYCAKYVAKVEEHPTNPHPGRFWGIATRRNRVETLLEAEITDQEFYRIRRLFRRYMGKHDGYFEAGGRDSGVWTRITEGGAKRALAWAASARESTTSRPWPETLLAPYDHDRQPFGIGSSNSALRSGDQPSPTDRTTYKPKLPLYDDSDLQRRRLQL